jgi:putative Holliday junction resolvase
MGKLLGIDYGMKRTGLAITDDYKIIASPLTTVDTKDILPFLEALM